MCVEEKYMGSAKEVALSAGGPTGYCQTWSRLRRVLRVRLRKWLRSLEADLRDPAVTWPVDPCQVVVRRRAAREEQGK
jgi:hypothetical protein